MIANKFGSVKIYQQVLGPTLWGKVIYGEREGEPLQKIGQEREMGPLISGKSGLDMYQNLNHMFSYSC